MRQAEQFSVEKLLELKVGTTRINVASLDIPRQQVQLRRTNNWRRQSAEYCSRVFEKNGITCTTHVKTMAQPKIFKNGRRHLSQMHTTNYMSFIREKTAFEKILSQ